MKRAGGPIVELARLTWEEAQTVLDRGAVALLPTGATEPHGPHLPLDTDVIIAHTAAVRAVTLLLAAGVRALVLPPLAYAVTEYATGFAGALSLPPSTARALVRDVLLAAVRAGFRGVVVCNAHLEPANIDALRGGVEDAVTAGARAALPDVTRKPHALALGEEFKSGACHAGRYETSLVLAADPFLVRDAATSLEPNPISLSRAIRDGKKTFLEAGGARAYFGDPAAASVAEGESLYDALAAIFADAARNLAGGT